MKALVDHFWVRYRKYLLIRCAIPSAVYLVATLLYTSNYTLKGIEEDQIWAFGPELVLRFLLIILCFYFLYFEVRAMVRDGASYFVDPFNYADITLICLNFYLIEEALNGTNTDDEVANKVRPIASIVVLLSWLKSFYWLKLFGATSFYVRLVIWALYDIRHFMVLFVMILMTFGNTIMILSQGREDILYRDYTSNNFINVVMN